MKGYHGPVHNSGDPNDNCSFYGCCNLHSNHHALPQLSSVKIVRVLSYCNLHSNHHVHYLMDFNENDQCELITILFTAATIIYDCHIHGKNTFAMI